MSDARSPRIDPERAKRGPTRADLEAMPATTAADWADATIILPVDRDIFEEAAAKQHARAKAARGAGALVRRQKLKSGKRPRRTPARRSSAKGGK
jgi:hypothetical protein